MMGTAAGLDCLYAIKYLLSYVSTHLLSCHLYRDLISGINLRSYLLANDAPYGEIKEGNKVSPLIQGGFRGD
jgi:hypothetical protein